MKQRNIHLVILQEEIMGFVETEQVILLKSLELGVQ